ncbi:hypothetical protein QTH90_31330 [Variovorax sp. J2P1-59]|uniref:hypothetical protein n=1 Tax=Variovorax flavidus TaxID=3053501 RepID=UPI0025782748|nr:hypothetical protein [Variovorax sp. J2P1-59]MDM0078934.1 hypothetical protein [Variovorax sp. J2P1-59]
MDMARAAGPELALAIIATCSKRSFELTFGADPGECGVELSSEAHALLHGQPNKPPVTDKLKRSWVDAFNAALATVWLVPTLLAFFMLWLSFGTLALQQERLTKREAEVAALQGTLINEAKGLVVTAHEHSLALAKVNFELTKQLREKEIKDPPVRTAAPPATRSRVSASAAAKPP